MKKLFSKALSLVLTLALLATVFSFIGVTASAANTYDTVKESVTNKAKDVYFIDFTNYSGGTPGQLLAVINGKTMPDVDCTGKTIMISYSYYLKSELHNSRSDEIFARNWANGGSGSEDANVPNLAQNGETFLREGMGSYLAMYTCPSSTFIYGVSKEKWVTPTNADLYIWDFSITIDGVAVDTNPITADDNRAGDAANVSVVSYEDVLNARKAWNIELNGVAQNDGFGYFGNLNLKAGDVVKYSFDYFLDTKQNHSLGIENVGAGGHLSRTGFTIDGVSKDSAKLVAGQHTITGTYNVTGSVAAFNFKNTNAITLNGVLRVWNLVIEVTAAKDGLTTRQVVNADFSHAYNTIEKSAERNAIITELSYGELMATRKAYRLEYKTMAANGQTNGWNFTESNIGGAEYVISFNYKIVGAVTTNAIVTQDVSGGDRKIATAGDTKGEATLLADGKEHYYEWNNGSNDSAIYFRLNLQSPDVNNNVTVYVWDLVARRTDQNYNMQVIETATRNGEANFKPLDNIHCTYADVVKETEAMCIDFSTAETEAEYNEEGILTGYKQARHQLAVKQNGNDGDVVFGFDYYLADAGENEVLLENIAGGKMTDDITGSNFLKPGRHTYTITGRKFSEFGLGGGYNICAALRLNVESSNAKLYIWNLTCTITVTTTNEDGTTSVSATECAGFDKGIFNAANNLYAEPTVSVVNYADVDNKFDANNDGATNVLDLIRAKRVALNEYLTYDKANLGYAKLDAETLVEMKKAVLA